MLVTEEDAPKPEPGEAPPQEGNAPHALSEILLRRYLLRDLLWCQPCDRPIVPILLRPASRYYACLSQACPHPALPARVMEYRVWGRFVRLYGSMAQGVPRERRHDALRQMLWRVVVGRSMTDLRCEWRA